MNRIFSCLIALAVVVTVARSSEARVATTIGTESYATRGEVKGFGPGRGYVLIAHEAIDGYMMAMTMSFEPRSSAQLDSVRVGDRVALRFTVTEDGHRRIDSLRKE